MLTSVPFEIFSGLLDGVTMDIIGTLPRRTYQPGEVLLAEGEVNDTVFLVEEGELEVWKGPVRGAQGVCVARLKSGNCFGEMSVINSMPSTASIVAATATRTRLMKLMDLPTEGDVRELITLNLARTLVARLQDATTSIREKHAAEIKAMKVLASASAFLTRILTALSFYMFSMPVIAFITPLLPSNSLISFFFITLFLWLVLDYMKGRADIVREHFGMTLDRWPRQIWRGLLWAGPLMGVYVAMKLIIMTLNPGIYRFWDPMAAFSRNHPPSWWAWGGFALVYAILSFAQEFVRCATQGTLDMVNPKQTAGKYWGSILVADVVFTSMHMHLSWLFAVQAFVAGLLFGVQFWKERSYLAVAVAHSTVGVWAVFIVGVPHV